LHILGIEWLREISFSNYNIIGDAMGQLELEKVIIVEGRSDKKKVESIISEPITIICTNGTISTSKLDELIDELYNKDVYILVDADDAGEKLRKQFRREFPEAEHLYIDKMYREVATAPEQHIATVLLGANIDVDAAFL
jgi:toprim domain protein